MNGTLLVPSKWDRLATVVSSRDPLCPLHCQTGQLLQDGGEDAGLAVLHNIIYISDRAQLANMSQVCLQGRQEAITVISEEKEESDETECDRWCSR